ncbi:KUP/HAK/KT family potassium transporter [Rhizobium sullae]
MLGALGVVYGDIGTSPLYALREALLIAASDGSVLREDVLASRHESDESVRLLRTYGDRAARIDVSRRSGLRSMLSVGVQM